MKIIDVLKETNARVSVGNRWLVWNDADLWVVYEHTYYAKRVKTICVTADEDEAVAALLDEEESDDDAS